jgi:hypothetical protein
MSESIGYSALLLVTFVPLLLKFAEQYTWTIIKFILMNFKILTFTVCNSNKIKTIIGKIKISSDIDEEGLPIGYFYGYHYFGHIEHNNDCENNNSKLWIITFKSIFDQMSKSDIEKKSDQNENSIDIWNKQGNYFHFHYVNRKLIVMKKPTSSQQNILEKIQTQYNSNPTKNCVVFVHGKPGSGKSTLALLLTKQFKGNYCNTFNNTEPADALDGLYCRVEPTETSPLILLLDEVDIILHNISSDLKVYKQHTTSPREVYDKRTWNSFLDKIDQGLYPNLIIIMTSNKSKDIIDSYDKSFIREGRVNLYFELEDHIKLE